MIGTRRLKNVVIFIQTEIVIIENNKAIKQNDILRYKAFDVGKYIKEKHGFSWMIEFENEDGEYIEYGIQDQKTVCGITLRKFKKYVLPLEEILF